MNPVYMFDEQHTCSLSSESLCVAAMEEDNDGDVPRHQRLGMALGDAGWYLSANGKKTHGLIVGAFVDMLVAINEDGHRTSASVERSLLFPPLFLSTIEVDLGET
jgi:hypothetical protein